MMNESRIKDMDSTSMEENIQKNIVNIFPDEQPTQLSEDQEILKRQIYEHMNPRRRKFVDKLGYEQWDPFQAPKDPLDIRRDLTNRTFPELLAAFMKEHPGKDKSSAWKNGVRECALGIIVRDEKYQAIFDFCHWYYKLLEKEGYLS